VEGVARLHELLDTDEPAALTAKAFIEPRRLANLGSILKEAIMNALKYAFGNASGKIVCAFSREGDRCVPSDYDNAGGLGTCEFGLGLRLMAGLAEQLNGALQIHALEPGTLLAGSFPDGSAVGAATLGSSALRTAGAH
jgi:two-component sensor histidine kinase